MLEDGKVAHPWFRLGSWENFVFLADGLADGLAIGVAIYGEILFLHCLDRPRRDLPNRGTFPEVLTEHHQIRGGE